jgi:hypothetical protein
MSLRQCIKCNEMVDEAKAFCPGCGHAVVSEDQSLEMSLFDLSSKTAQYDEGLFEELLSDMGLDISKTPNAGEKNRRD